jgi:hypothetical protein
LTLLRTCARHGLTRTAFWALPENEQLDMLAYDFYRQQQLSTLMTSIRDAKYPDGGALVAALVAALE